MIRTSRGAILARQAGGLALGLILGATGAQAQQLSVAHTKLPSGQGNPFLSVGGVDLTITHAFFDPLFIVDGSNGTIQPGLALSFANVNPTTWTVKLREGIKFSSGRAADATAVAEVINYLTSDEGKVVPTAREIKSLKSARAIDATTVEVTTNQPNPILMREFAWSSIADLKAFLDQGKESFARTPVGSGPFTVTNWGADRVTATANANSWRKPKVSGITFSALPDKTTRVQALLSNQVQVALMLAVDDKKILSDRGYDFVSTPGDAVHVLRFNQFQDSPVKDVRVRRAMVMATNRDAIANGLLGGLVHVGTQPINPSAFGYNPDIKPLPYDPVAAKALLAEAGYPNGFKMLSEVYIQEADNRDAFSAIGQDLAKIGITVEFREMQLQELINKALGRQPWESPMSNVYYRSGFQADGMRPINTFGNACGDIKFYCDEEIMPVVRAANQEFDDKKRGALIQQIMKRYADQVSAIFLHEDYTIYGKAKNVEVTPFRSGLDSPWHSVVLK